MNWLQKTASKPLQKTAQSMFSGCSFSGPTTINVGENGGFRSSDNPRDVFTSLIRKNDRYASDPYRVWISRSANSQGRSVVLEVRAERDGMLAYSDIWKYAEDEEQDLEETFNALITVAKNIKAQVEEQQLPTALIGPMFKKSTRFLAAGNREGSKGVTNYLYDLEEDKEGDWRSTLYGDRYPDQVQTPPAKVNWNSYESQKIDSKGKGRQQHFRIVHDG